MPTDRSDRLGGEGQEPLGEVLNRLLESMMDQTRLMGELTAITGSLARSESRDSIADLITALKTDRASMAPPGRSDAPVPPDGAVAGTFTGSTDALVVLSQYDQLRAGLGRVGAASFYVSATLGEYGLLVEGPTLVQATRLTIGDVTYGVPSGRTTVTIDDLPIDLLDRSPAVRVWSGERLIAVARSIEVDDRSSARS